MTAFDRRRKPEVSSGFHRGQHMGGQVVPRRNDEGNPYIGSHRNQGDDSCHTTKHSSKSQRRNDTDWKPNSRRSYATCNRIARITSNKSQFRSAASLLVQPHQSCGTNQVKTVAATKSKWSLQHCPLAPVIPGRRVFSFPHFGRGPPPPSTTRGDTDACVMQNSIVCAIRQNSSAPSDTLVRVRDHCRWIIPALQFLWFRQFGLSTHPPPAR